MSLAHFEALRTIVEQSHSSAHLRATADHYRELGYTPKRWRWDMFWRMDTGPLRNWMTSNEIYSYLNDNHIDTALRVLFPHKW